MSAVCGVYVIEHIESGRVYVGSSNAIVARLCKHRSQLRHNAHHSLKLQNAWNKYGETAFAFKTILICAEEDLVAREQEAIDSYRAASRRGFNILPNAGGTRGYKHSEEARANMSRAQTGRVVSAETRAKIAAAHSGIKQKPEAVEKRRIARIGKCGWPADDPRRQELAEANKKRVVTPEIRAKMAAAKLGKKRVPHSDEVKAKIAATNRATYKASGRSRAGIPRSEDVKRKVSEGLRQYWAEKKAMNDKCAIPGGAVLPV